MTCWLPKVSDGSCEVEERSVLLSQLLRLWKLPSHKCCDLNHKLITTSVSSGCAVPKVGVILPSLGGCGWMRGASVWEPWVYCPQIGGSESVVALVITDSSNEHINAYWSWQFWVQNECSGAEWLPLEGSENITRASRVGEVNPSRALERHCLPTALKLLLKLFVHSFIHTFNQYWALPWTL